MSTPLGTFDSVDECPASYFWYYVSPGATIGTQITDALSTTLDAITTSNNFDYDESDNEVTVTADVGFYHSNPDLGHYELKATTGAGNNLYKFSIHDTLLDWESSR